jgi:hypothetical protein
MPLNVPEPLKSELENVNTVLKDIFKESDRHAVVLVGAELDVQLEKLMTHVLLPEAPKSTPLFDNDGVLANFGARIEMAYRMGLLPDPWHQELHVIRKIRNHFGHRLVGVDFNDQKVRDTAKNLTLGREQIEQMLKMTKAPSPYPETAYEPKNLFRLSSGFLLAQLVGMRYKLTRLQPVWKVIANSPVVVQVLAPPEQRDG